MADQQLNEGGGIYGLFLLLIDIGMMLFKFWYYIFESIVGLFTQKEEQDVKGDIVLITGTAHGIGKETALEYASKGAIVVCWDINEKGNNETVKQIKSMGGKAYGYVCDVTKREDIIQVVEKVKKEVGFVSILINNAGIMPCHPLKDHTEQEIRLMYDINVFAHFWLMQSLVPDMIKNKRGHIVALSSCAGLFGVKNLVPYCGTKFAVRGIMLAYREELRLQGLGDEIKFTTIYPYMVDTGLCKKPRFRFETMKLVKPQDAAKAIVTAQRRNIAETTIPGHFLYIEKIMNLLPKKSVHVVNDFLDSGVESDL